MAGIIRHIATGSTNDDLFTTAEFERSVTVWSFERRCKVSDILTWLDFGGERLSIVGKDNPRIAVGAYNRYGAALYDAVSGELIWHRTDLKGVQFVRGVHVESVEHIGVGRESGSFHILDIGTGETITTLRGVKKVYSDSTGKALSIGNTQLELLNTSDWKPRWRHKDEPKSSVLDAAFGKDTVAVSFMRGPVRLFDMGGDVNGEYHPGANSHIVHIGWNDSLNHWVGIELNLSDSTMNRLLIDDVGNMIHTVPIGGYEHAFFDSARYVITSDGEVRSTDSNKLVWKFV